MKDVQTLTWTAGISVEREKCTERNSHLNMKEKDLRGNAITQEREMKGNTVPQWLWNPFFFFSKLWGSLLLQNICNVLFYLSVFNSSTQAMVEERYYVTLCSVISVCHFET